MCSERKTLGENMANSNMEKDIERALSNTMKVCFRTGKVSGKLTEKQIQTLTKYKEYYEQLPSARGGNNKLASVWNAVMFIRRLGLYLKENGVQGFEEAKKEDILGYIASMKGLSDITISRSKTYIRMFYKWIYGVKKKYEYPEVVDDPRLVPQIVKNKKKPRDLLTNEEIRKLLEVSNNDRQRCIIMLSIGEGGLRSGEIASLNVGSVEFDDRGVKVWIEKSKSKERYVRLIHAEPYLRNYLNQEYSLDKNNKENPLFYGMAGKEHNTRVRGSALTDLLQRLGHKAKIKKRIYIHLGRAINISKLNKKGMSAEISAKRFGITANTLRNVYLTIDDKDADEVYLKTEGKQTDKEIINNRKEDALLEPRICTRCQARFPDKPELWRHSSTALYCSCGMVLDPIEAEKIAQRNEASEKALNNFLQEQTTQLFFKEIEKMKKQIEELKK